MARKPHFTQNDKYDAKQGKTYVAKGGGGGAKGRKHSAPRPPQGPDNLAEQIAEDNRRMNADVAPSEINIAKDPLYQTAKAEFEQDKATQDKLLRISKMLSRISKNPTYGQESLEELRKKMTAMLAGKREEAMKPLTEAHREAASRDIQKRSHPNVPLEATENVKKLKEALKAAKESGLGKSSEAEVVKDAVDNIVKGGDNKDTDAVIERLWPELRNITRGEKGLQSVEYQEALNKAIKTMDGLIKGRDLAVVGGDETKARELQALIAGVTNSLKSKYANQAIKEPGSLTMPKVEIVEHEEKPPVDYLADEDEKNAAIQAMIAELVQTGTLPTSKAIKLAEGLTGSRYLKEARKMNQLRFGEPDPADPSANSWRQNHYLRDAIAAVLASRGKPALEADDFSVFDKLRTKGWTDPKKELFKTSIHVPIIGKKEHDDTDLMLPNLLQELQQQYTSKALETLDDDWLANFLQRNQWQEQITKQKEDEARAKAVDEEMRNKLLEEIKSFKPDNDWSGLTSKISNDSLRRMIDNLYAAKAIKPGATVDDEGKQINDELIRLSKWLND